MTIKANQRPTISTGEVRNAAFSFVHSLDTGEVISSSCVTEVTSSDLTLTTSTVNSSAHVIATTTASSGQAVLVQISGQQANTLYTLQFKAITDASQTLVRHASFWSD